MIHRIQRRLGTAGLVVAILALVIALAGTAFAAKGVFTKKQEKQIVKIAKKYAGQQGPQGLKGDAGPAGLKGDTGDRGPEGQEGPKGKEGSPWSAGGTLPSEESLSGHWAAGVSSFIASFEGISFALPLESAPTAVVVPAGESKPGCPGSAADPAAETGKLCVYVVEALGTVSVEAADAVGAVLKVENGSEPSFGYGSWAVTAP